ncbi:phospholipid phosphatase [Leptotrichia sp. oral taxon 847]|uniref:phospholipid phosphatase n=1 Tax=Leptotrichia sp. oral taxon 847 TaxID=1785996 RepID=UPI00076843D7|nr:phospholipid phosphatase [Leptotrichia sp. oral taxon 847]AMD94492.1 phospholipid phosphatase [Leptotrichia sp. oral taxon 847]
MNIKKELNKNKNEKSRILMMSIIAYFAVFVLKKIDVVSNYLGIVLMILLYVYANYNLINIFFISKRTTFKIYIFLFLEVIYFFTGAFSLVSIIVYLILLWALDYSIIKDEGREETPRINSFFQIYVVFKVVFILTMIFFM